MTPSRDICRLLEIMAALRTPKTGCPWDLEQDFRSIAPYTIEEAYEVADAIERGDMVDLADELGDLLLQVVFHARMAEETRTFDFGDVVEAITTKMIRRHPHVFDVPIGKTPDDVKVTWDQIKEDEKRETRTRKGLSDTDHQSGAILDSVPGALPGLMRAVKLQKRAGDVGFDWNDPKAVLAKLREELDEVERELDEDPDNKDRLSDEIGDVLFAVANLARHLKIEPDAALRRANQKFIDRFAYIERSLTAVGRSVDAASLDEMEALWQEAKSVTFKPTARPR